MTPGTQVSDEAADDVVSQRLTTMKQVVANGADYSCLTCGATVYERDLYMPLLEGHEHVSRFTVRDFTVRCEGCIDESAKRPDLKITPPAEDPEVYLSTGSIAEATRLEPGIVGEIRDKIVLPFEEAFATDGDDWYQAPDQPTFINHNPEAPAEAEIPAPIEAPEDDRVAGAGGEEWEPPEPPAGFLTTFGKGLRLCRQAVDTVRSANLASLLVGVLVVVAALSAAVTWGVLAGVTLTSLAVAGYIVYNNNPELADE